MYISWVHVWIEKPVMGYDFPATIILCRYRSWESLLIFVTLDKWKISPTGIPRKSIDNRKITKNFKNSKARWKPAIQLGSLKSLHVIYDCSEVGGHSFSETICGKSRWPMKLPWSTHNRKNAFVETLDLSEREGR